VVKAVNDVAMVEQRPMMEGRRMVMTIGPRGGVIRPPLVVGPGSSSIGTITPSRPVESTGGVTPIAAASSGPPATAPGPASAAAAAPISAVPSAKAPVQSAAPTPAAAAAAAPAAAPKQTAATKA
jgi:hypothetical protein